MRSRRLLRVSNSVSRSDLGADAEHRESMRQSSSRWVGNAHSRALFADTFPDESCSVRTETRLFFDQEGPLADCQRRQRGFTPKNPLPSSRTADTIPISSCA
ncbi:uncharacterized protein UBRO_20559 [Ustilago bromivora]|uniref:Uncharacterized protein n=1 Tax=Ustilago bromivora TaxID=307758 RepID=A0A1K0H0H3_9BASI|nr:uncharacterized protein UBRO_20559 [Ustilago bromivora]